MSSSCPAFSIIFIEVIVKIVLGYTNSFVNKFSQIRKIPSTNYGASSICCMCVNSKAGCSLYIITSSFNVIILFYVIYLFIYLFICLFVCLFVCLFIYLIAKHIQ